MLLPIQSQGFPELIQELGIQSPLQGPFWNFESTVLPTIDVRNPRVGSNGGPPFDGVSTAGQLPTPAAGDFLASINPLLIPGAYAMHLEWAWVNTTATNAFLAFQHTNDTGTVVLSEEIIEVIGGTTDGTRTLGSGFKNISIQKTIPNTLYGIRILQSLATAGTVVWGGMRVRFLGQFPEPSSF